MSSCLKPQDRAKGLDVTEWVGFVAVLAGDAVVAFGPVRRRTSDDALCEAVGHGGEHLVCVTNVQGGGVVAEVDQC